MLKPKRALALLIAALTVIAISTTTLAAVFAFEGTSFKGVVITKSVQLRDGNGKKAGKLYEGDTVTIVNAYGNYYGINIDYVYYEVPMSAMAVFYDDPYQGTAKKAVKVYSDIIAKSKYLVGTLAKGSQFNVFGRIGNWYILYMADTDQLVYVQVKNVNVDTGYYGG